MTAPLVQRLSLVVDAATGNTETRMDAVAASVRETGEAAQRSAGQVAAAAERVAAAQLRRDDAADRVALAERRLTEVSERYAAGSSQVLAAEQRLESSRRQLHVATRQVEDATRDQARVQNDAAEATARLATQQDRAGAGADRFGQQLAGISDLVKGYAAFQLGDFLRDSVTGFAEGARGAATLATSMNATIEQGGRLSTLFTTLGLDSADLLEIQAEFAQKVGANGEALAEFGAGLERNENGTINWALTLEDALVQLQKIPDATERNRRGFALFGEEGYKQLSRLLSSGVSVEDALARIGTPFDEEDVEQARRFDAAMADLSLTGQQLGTGLGSVLVPVVTTLADGLNFVVDTASAVPGPLGIATTAAVAWGVASRSAATEGTFLHGALDGARDRAAGFRTAVDNASTGSGLLARGMGAGRVAVGGLVSALGGPLGVAVVGAVGGFTLLNALTGDNSERAAAAAQANEDLAAALQESRGVITQNVREQAAASAQQAGILAVARDIGIAQGDVTDALLGNEDAYRRVTQALDDYYDASLSSENAGDEEMTETAEAARLAREELDTLRGTTEENVTAQREMASELQQTADKQALATAATDALTTAIESGNVSTEELTRLAHEAAVAQDAAAGASNRAQAAIDAVRASTTGATQATLEWINARYANEDAQFAFLTALDQARTATDDATTSVNEQRQAQVNLMNAALRAAGASADAAVQNAEAAGQVVDDVAEAQIRAEAMLASLRENINRPGLTEAARMEMQGLIDQLQAAKDRGDITAVLSLTGAPEVTGELDEATEDRDTTVTVESRGGPAVIRYLDGIASADRLALIRVESRNGPAVNDYLNGLARERLAIIRVETRNGPAVDEYLDGLAGQRRTAVIDVQTRERPAPGGGGTGAAGLFGAAPISIGSLIVQPQVDGGGRLTGAAQRMAGEQVVASIREYERRNGTSWRRGP